MNIKKYFKGYNFLTPTVVEYKETDKYYIEVSRGSAIGHDCKIFGVTVVSKATEKVLHDLNRLCWSREEANNYIERLDHACSR